MLSDRQHLRRQNGIIAGVCGGLGEFTGINPWWFRVLFLFLALPGGAPGIIPYIILWIAIPRLNAPLSGDNQYRKNGRHYKR